MRREVHEPRFLLGFVSETMSFPRNDMSVHMVVATTMHGGWLTWSHRGVQTAELGLGRLSQVGAKVPLCVCVPGLLGPCLKLF